MARLEQSFSNLSKRLDDAEVFKSEYRKTAIEKGFNNPAIVPVRLIYQDTPIQQPPTGDTKGRVANTDYNEPMNSLNFLKGKCIFGSTVI